MKFTLSKREIVWLCIFAVLAALFILTGCYGPQKATKQVVKAQANYPEVVAGLCGNFYNPIEWIKDSIVYKQGETVYSHDTVEVDCDSVMRAWNNNSRSTSEPPVKPPKTKVPCPPCPERVDTFYINKTQVQVNRAKELALEADLKSKIAITEKYRTQRNAFIWICIGLSAVLLVIVVIKYLKNKLS